MSFFIINLVSLGVIIGYRKEQTGDSQFLSKLYRSTREHEMLHLGWTEEQKQSFCEFQFKAQTSHYRTTFKEAEFKIIRLNKKDIGRLYLLEKEDSIRIIDISILPAYRGKGIGTQILKGLIHSSEKKQIDLELHVELKNKAFNLYSKLGFEIVEKGKTHYFMIRKPVAKH